MKVFVICPVRNVSDDVRAWIAIHVALLESQGHEVHWPSRDTNQSDPVGLNICLQNARAIRAADEVHIWYDPASQGSVFDLGALLMSSLVVGPKKKVVLINQSDVQPTEGKSFTNVLLAMADNS